MLLYSHIEWARRVHASTVRQDMAAEVPGFQPELILCNWFLSLSPQSLCVQYPLGSTGLRQSSWGFWSQYSDNASMMGEHEKKQALSSSRHFIMSPAYASLSRRAQISRLCIDELINNDNSMQAASFIPANATCNALEPVAFLGTLQWHQSRRP